MPDSLFGTAWPAIYADFELPISYGSFITTTVACCTIVSSLISPRLIRKLGTSRVAAISTLLTAIALIGFSFSPNIWFMVLLAIPLGLGAGAIDVALNHYVALHYSAKQMSFLHCTYLVEYKKMTAEQAAGVVLFYFIGMAVGRFLSGIAADKLHSWKIIMLGESVLGIAVLLLAIPGPALLSAIGLFMIGLGNGPLFPNFNYLAPESFGKDVSESVISLQMAAAYVGILVGPLLCGLLGQNVGMFIFPLYIICAFSVMTGVTISVRRLLKKRKTARNAIPIFIIGSMKMYVFQCCLRMVPPSAGCGSPVEISAEGRSTDRAGRRERLTEPRYGVRVVPTNPFMPKWESRDKKTTGDSP